MVVNNKLTVSRYNVRKLKQELYYISKYGLKGHINYCDIPLSPKNYLKEIKGKINFIYMVDNNLGEELMKSLDEIIKNL